jgi:hypothetical protein
MISASTLRLVRGALIALTFGMLSFTAPAHAADPVKVGVGLSLTGGVAGPWQKRAISCQAGVPSTLRKSSGPCCLASAARTPAS